MKSSVEKICLSQCHLGEARGDGDFVRWKRLEKRSSRWTVEPQKVAELRRNSLARTIPFLYVEGGGTVKKDLPMCVKGLFG